ncbi:MAG TPA: glutathione S-transferase family protein [Candidatus Binataceae bacterium]|nr:glutathione S-transferase family protein [Candidatus Binataceae bacterium]
MPTLYGALGSPFVRKAIVALTEKGIAYDHDPVVPFGPNPEYRKISPLGKIPAFRDGDRTLADSSVILAYLERTHPEPPLYPSDAYDYARALWFEEYGDGGLAPVLGSKIFFARVIGPRFMNQPTDEAAVQKALNEEVPPLFDYLEKELEGKDYLVANRFTIADIGVATIFVNFQFAGCSVDAKRWPKLAAYVERIHNRPSFKGIIDKEKAAFGVK